MVARYILAEQRGALHIIDLASNQRLDFCCWEVVNLVCQMVNLVNLESAIWRKCDIGLRLGKFGFNFCL